MRHGTAVLTARVGADIHGDRRPVQGATVSLGHRHARTGHDGVAVLRIPLRRDQRLAGRLKATAGDTSLPASINP
jgi:hypothetical protein